MAKTLAANLLKGLHWVGVISKDVTPTSPTIVPRIYILEYSTEQICREV